VSVIQFFNLLVLLIEASCPFVVTKNGRLLGIITKKDILSFMKEGER